MRKALVVGIDHYSHISPLFGCVKDAHSVKAVMEKHSDGSINFGVKLRVATSAKDAIARGELKDLVSELFTGDSEIALFYFAGHGHLEPTGGYLCASDCQRGDDGVSLFEVITLAQKSGARNTVIVLDSCFSGIAGTRSTDDRMVELSEGMTILTASAKDQYASEKNGSGVFTGLLVDALSGAARNLLGEVTPGSAYAHIDQSLGPWQQRPIFRTNVKSFVSLRRVQPPIRLADLQRLAELFPEPGYEFKLDPTFEPELRGRPEGAPPPDPQNVTTFAILQNYRDVNLLVTVGATHMWHAAMQSKACKLTALGEHYRRLVADGRI